MFKKDNWLLGISLGTVIPLVVFVLLYLVIKLFNIDNESYLFDLENIGLVGVFFNIIIFRYYMVNLKYDKTGRGILMMTILFAILFFLAIGY